ncbi:hypothetical protein [Pseudomonas benzenivorans]|uniref:Uncharacterized protein n=1 Tax=Pseudomonas benzenivorans TaxID=556533 RepID=A0ABY5HA24_9PSED|nr:hypothetical protein [Pseudomonas benzenivorans]UTW09008.1 hypothetical protein KDW96_06795 [Pseudomonas benzenivorans]
MKYKNIKSAIHNFGHSFVSLMNYVDQDYVIDEIGKIHNQGYDIEINWLTREFSPAQLESERIKKSIGYWGDSLKKHCSSHNVNLESLSSLLLVWPASQSKYMQAIDNKGTEHKIYINEAS